MGIKWLIRTLCTPNGTSLDTSQSLAWRRGLLVINLWSSDCAVLMFRTCTTDYLLLAENVVTLTSVARLLYAMCNTSAAMFASDADEKAMHTQPLRIKRATGLGHDTCWADFVRQNT
jgi:hypothetical protein